MTFPILVVPLALSQTQLVQDCWLKGAGPWLCQRMTRRGPGVRERMEVHQARCESQTQKPPGMSLTFCDSLNADILLVSSQVISVRVLGRNNTRMASPMHTRSIGMNSMMLIARYINILLSVRVVFDIVSTPDMDRQECEVEGDGM
jgi:hypothetical protein